MYRVDYESIESLNRLAVILRDNNSCKIGNVIPPKIAKSIVSLVPDEWFEPKGDELIEKYKLDLDKYTENHRVLDICCNSGVLLTMFMNKFYDVLHNYKNFTEETDLCYEYILKNLVYGICSNKFLCREIRGVLYNNKNVHGNIFNYGVSSEVVNSNFEIRDGKVFIYDSNKKEKVEMKFDVVCGNPPYNDGVYLDFVLKGHEIAKSYDLWITPINAFYQYKYYSVIKNSMSKCVYYPESSDVFDIRLVEGVAYYLLENNSQSCDITNISNDNAILNSSVTRSLSNDCNKFCFLNIGQSVIDKVNKVGNFNYFKDIACKDKRYTDCTGNVISTGGSSINKKLFTKQGSLVVLSHANGNSKFNVCCSDDEFEFKSQLSFVNTKFIRFLVFAHREYNVNNDRVWTYVPDPGSFDRIFEDRPLDDYTPDENGEYIDKDGNKHCSLYIKYGLIDEEINVIESVIRERK